MNFPEEILKEIEAILIPVLLAFLAKGIKIDVAGTSYIVSITKA